MTYRTVGNQTTSHRGGRADGAATLGLRHVKATLLENQYDHTAVAEDNLDNIIGGAEDTSRIFAAFDHRPFAVGQIDGSPTPAIHAPVTLIAAVADFELTDSVPMASPYDFKPHFGGGGTLVLSLEGPTIPAGLTFVDGVLDGTPTAVADTPGFFVMAVNVTGQATTDQFAINVAA